PLYVYKQKLQYPSNLFGSIHVFVSHEHSVIKSVLQSELEACRQAEGKIPQQCTFTWNCNSQLALWSKQQSAPGDNIGKIAIMFESGNRNNSIKGSIRHLRQVPIDI